MTCDSNNSLSMRWTKKQRRIYEINEFIMSSRRRVENHLMDRGMDAESGQTHGLYDYVSTFTSIVRIKCDMRVNGLAAVLVRG